MQSRVAAMAQHQAKHLQGELGAPNTAGQELLLEQMEAAEVMRLLAAWSQHV